MAALDDHVEGEVANLFDIVVQAREAGITFIRDRVEAGQPLMGYEVDDAVRSVVRDAGYSDRFVHRTGHSITTETHGSGCNLDNLETHDDRLLLPSTICSMEPGIYLPHIGVRTEVNIIVLDGVVEVTGVPAQDAIHPLLA
jgi:Xaa-Pro aminopeptidase